MMTTKLARSGARVGVAQAQKAIHRMVVSARNALLSFGLAALLSSSPAAAQAPEGVITAKPSEQSSAYFNFAMGHMYAELANAYGNRGEYVNKAIDFYKQAMKIDPSATYIGEQLAELYSQSGQLERAQQLAQDLIKSDPSSTAAHKILARIYSRQIGDDQNGGRVDYKALQNAIFEYRTITELDPKDQESLGMLARLYRAAKDDENAEKTYKALLAIDGSDEDGLTGLAAVYADRGDLNGAIGMLKLAMDKNPDPRTVVTLAEFYDQNRQYSEGADTWFKALPMTNNNVRVRRAWAQDLFLAARLDDALKAYGALAAEDPKDAELQIRLAEIYGRMKDFNAAHAAIAKAKGIDNGPDTRFAEAQLLETEGKHAEGIAALQSLLSDTKKSVYNDGERAQRMETLQALSRMQKNAGKPLDSVVSLRQITDLNPEAAPRVEVEVVETLMSAKEFKQAREAADSAIKKYWDNRLVQLEHASVMSELGQYAQAIKELRALKGADKDREILIAISQVQDKAKQFNEAQKTLDAVEALSGSDQDRQTVAFMRGALYERQKNYDDAEKQFRKVLDMDPRNSGALNYLGYMLADRGVRLDEAEKLIADALKNDPDNGAYLDSLGWVLFKQNKLEEAAKNLRDALEKIHDDPTVHEHLGDVYLKQGKVKEAVQQWEASVSQLKSAAPAEQDPEELSRVNKKLEANKGKR